MALLLLAICGCAATEDISQAPPQFTVVAHIGRLVERIALPGGSVGGRGATMVPLIIAGKFVPLFIPTAAAPAWGTTGTPGFFIYEVQVEGASTKRIKVASRGDAPPGACVEVLVKHGSQETDAYPIGEAALVSRHSAGDAQLGARADPLRQPS